MLERAVDWGLVTGPATYLLTDSARDHLLAARRHLAEWAGQRGYALSWSGEERGLLRTASTEVSLVLAAASVEELAGRADPQGPFHLLIAHAVLDLVDFPSLLPGLLAQLADNGLAYLTCNFDGDTVLLPESPGAAEREIIRRYHASMEARLSGASHTGRRLLTSLPPVASYFRQSGYRTVSVMPGTRFAFPEGRYFGYEQVYYAWNFNYRGPTYGWAAMPDQFVLDWVRHGREFAKPDQPIFARYVLISSHAAFNVQPPYIPDWEAIGDGSLYHERAKVYFPISWPELKDAAEGYLRAINYEFTILGDYLAKYVDSDALIIIMGDHQPNLQLTGAGEPWSVPVHIISRNPGLLAPFIKRG